MRDPSKRRRTQRAANRRWRERLRAENTRTVGLIVEPETAIAADRVADALEMTNCNRKEFFKNSMQLLVALIDLGVPLKNVLEMARSESTRN